MDYKKKYEELLARLQEAKENVYKTDECYCCVIDSIVPELKESEEEKAKRMLDIITYKMSQHQPDIFTGEENEWLNDWIEKQGQAFTKKDVDDAYLKGICDAKHELEKQGEKGTNGNKREIPNSAWSEEDEQYVMDAINLLSFGCSFHRVGEVKDWLKSLKDRVGNFDDGYKVGFSAAKHNQWKPSEEQINALAKNVEYVDISCTQPILKGLLEDLKKLREE